MDDVNPKSEELKSTGYELFILLLSLVSIFNLIVEWLGGAFDSSDSRLEVIAIVNGILTVFFLIDFQIRFFTAPSKSHYFFRNWGWSDLLACVPTLRIFRVFRIVRAGRLLRQFGLENMLKEVNDNRAGSALYLSIFGIIMVAQTAAVVVLSAESDSPLTMRNLGLQAVIAISFARIRWQNLVNFGVLPLTGCEPAELGNNTANLI